MEIILLIVGFFLGLFLWSNIIGSIFASLPLRMKMKKEGVIDKVGWLYIIGPMIIPIVVLAVTAKYLPAFFFGSVGAGITILFNIKGLKNEAAANFVKEEFSMKSIIQPKIPKWSKSKEINVTTKSQNEKVANVPKKNRIKHSGDKDELQSWDSINKKE